MQIFQKMAIQFGRQFAMTRRQIHGCVGKLKINMFENKEYMP
jgi:hypothetical protein